MKFVRVSFDGIESPPQEAYESEFDYTEEPSNIVFKKDVSEVIHFKSKDSVGTYHFDNVSIHGPFDLFNTGTHLRSTEIRSDKMLMDEIHIAKFDRRDSIGRLETGWRTYTPTTSYLHISPTGILKIKDLLSDNDPDHSLFENQMFWEYPGF